ncbi:MAG: hypothetical protein H6734_27245, partial [Alphaproteobacteria bacterium]|nr:hypothetical protein [Alphaproteobacteria bacterium]
MSGTLHRSLERHLRRLGIDPERGPSTPEQWAAFLDRVNGSFEAFDRERYVVQRSMEVSSREMESLHEAVRRDKERLSAVVEALPEAVVWLDDQLAVEDGNIQSVGLLGRRNAGRRIADLLELLTAQKVPMALPTSVEGLGGGLEEPDGWVSLPDGRRIPAAWTLVPVEGDHGEGALLVVSDLTERKQREQALRAAELDAEVSRRSRASRGRFLADMSHELRTPLNAILGYTELLMEEHEAADDLQRIHRASRHLLALINDLLDLSKIDAGKMQYDLRDVAVGPIVEDVLDTLRPVAAEQGNALRARLAEATVVADARRLSQCLLNLVGNACKFTTDGRVDVEVEVTAQRVRLHVRDTGVGIAPDDLERVFQAFAQADEVSGRGTGLGLPLTRALAVGMGGDLTATSVPGEGSTFTLVLPR